MARVVTPRKNYDNFIIISILKIISLFKPWIEGKLFGSIKSEMQLETLDGKKQRKFDLGNVFGNQKGKFDLGNIFCNQKISPKETTYIGL